MDIKVENLTHIYHPGTPYEEIAVSDLNLSIDSGTFMSIIGHTGSGKSTLIQHLNGLLKPTDGKVTAGGLILTRSSKRKRLKALREKVGLVFQYPEHQLFEETVEKDICFGPLNFGVSVEEAKRRSRECLKLVGLSQDILDRSPFDLSGGQMRRVAIAGILAIEPDVLVLDEPTAGLDPSGHRDMMALFVRLHKERGLTTIMVTHNMNDAALYSDEVLVMAEGRVVMNGKPEQVFSRVEDLRALGLDIPDTSAFLIDLYHRFDDVSERQAFSIEECAEAVREFLHKGEGQP